MKLMCRIAGHRINRKRVRRSGQTYIGRCRWCEVHMEKRPEGWVTVAEREGWNQDVAPDV